MDRFKEELKDDILRDALSICEYASDVYYTHPKYNEMSSHLQALVDDFYEQVYDYGSSLKEDISKLNDLGVSYE